MRYGRAPSTQNIILKMLILVLNPQLLNKNIIGMGDIHPRYKSRFEQPYYSVIPQNLWYSWHKRNHKAYLN